MGKLHPVLGSLVGALFLGISFLCFGAMQLTAEQQKWPSAPGKVIEVKYESRLSNRETIQYEVDGKLYTIDDIVAFGRRNEETTVRYNPLSPDVAKREPAWPNVLFSFPAFLGLIGAGFSYTAYRNWKRLGSEGRTWKVSTFASIVYSLFLVFVLGLFLSFQQFQSQHHAREAAAKGWRTTPGTIVSSRQDNDTRANTSMVAIRYEYNVDGKPYSGTSIDLSGSNAKGEAISHSSKDDPDSVAEMLQNFPVGKAVQVYYDPVKPTESVLYPVYYWKPPVKGVDSHLRGFGTFDNTGRFRRVTSEIPDIVGERYGWRLATASSQPVQHWKEEVTLPAAPRYWGEEEKGITRTIARDGRSCVSDGDSTSSSGYVQHYWTIAPNDPKGSYAMKVTLANMPPKSFKFIVR